MPKKEPDVGYKNPPKKNRFKKGQSGNPKGRPKDSRNTKTIIRDAMERRIPINLSGRKKMVKASEALVYRLIQTALSGDRHAAAMMINWRMQIDEQVTPEAFEALDAKDRARLHRYAKKFAKEVKDLGDSS